MLMNSSKKKRRDCSHSWPSLRSPAKLDYISCYISIGSQPFDQVAPQVFVGRRLGSSEGPCNNIELVQFKGVRHFSLYLFQVHYTCTVGGYIFFFNWDHFFFDLFANTCQSWKPEQQGTHMVSPQLFCSQVMIISTSTLFIVISWKDRVTDTDTKEQAPCTKYQTGNAKYP